MRRAKDKDVISAGCHFNPRTHEGCDVIPYAAFITYARFQSTHPRGVRLATVSYIQYLPLIFQSTHPRGVRLGALLNIGRVNKISIHAPTRGATDADEQVLPYCRDFNPRTHEGCDCLQINLDILSFLKVNFANLSRNDILSSNLSSSILLFSSHYKACERKAYFMCDCPSHRTSAI